MRSITFSLIRRNLCSYGVSRLTSKQQPSLLYSSMVSPPLSSSSLMRKSFRDPSRTSLFLPFRFASSSTAAKKVGADENLKRVLETEIECAEETEDLPQGGFLPDGFPFEIIDNPGEHTIILKRQFAGDNIEVEVHMPEMAGEGEEDEDEDDDDDKDDNNEASGQTYISLIVNISKGEGPRLEFCCSACPDEITIDSMLMKSPDVSSNEMAYEGPDFSDLDENLQKEFYKYLEDRGIKSSMTNFLQEYMISKDNREYKGWLKNMKDFIEN
ncbi:uncharacterized protein At2g39795, mitochondrial-like [Macadamia integrifolia]|uniref:uncharacterized protein At2g39795, mitochondrial-like n=1 Tax=Macadamia integrifolia TaxID=60698 RepID=UPI001C4ED789|nr:uncharacterized protein At2g39795, mitochondrial-like [Macadamia integrifolia]